MTIWAFVLSTLMVSQSLRQADSWAIRQLGGDTDGLMASLMPLLSAISAIPSSALRTTLNLTGSNRGNEANTAVTSFATSNTGIGGAGLSTGAIGQNTVANGGITIIRRGSEMLADQIVSALGGAATLMDMLQSYEQTGQVYLGNVRTSVQGLTSRLMNTAYNGANLMIQELSNQATSSPNGDFFFRRGGGGAAGGGLGLGGLAITTSRPRPFTLTASQMMPPDGFGFGSAINGETIADLGAGPNALTEQLNVMARQSGGGGSGNAVDGLSSVLVNAATPFGTSSENSSAVGTTNSPLKDGLPVSFSDSSLAPVQTLDDDSRLPSLAEVTGGGGGDTIGLPR